MACYKPLTAFQTKDNDIVFQEIKGSRPIELPCGQCIGCRITRSRDWATRCVHEASLHENNCFITLTYNPENCPPDGGLIKSDFQKFMKRLRKSIAPKKIKFYQCGEYGDKSNRPHYHAIIFGYNFDDWIYLYDSPGGQPIFMSPHLEKVWGLGFVTVGTVTFESAAYVARYCLKKINGEKAELIDEKTGLKHYERINSFTGEIIEVLPEYSTMSRGGKNGRGIAHAWISKFHRDCYPKDFTTIRGMKTKPPRYYDKYIEQLDVEMYDDIKEGRRLNAFINADENTTDRLRQKEVVKLAQNEKLIRSL